MLSSASGHWLRSNKLIGPTCLTTRKLGFSDGHFVSQNSQNSVTNDFLTDFATLRKSVVIMGVGKL